MKKITITIIAGLFGAIGSMPIYAANIMPLCGSDAVFCAYVSGLSSTDLQDGRQIKVALDGIWTPATCLNNTGTVELSAQTIQQNNLVDKHTMAVSVCNSPTDTKCTAVGAPVNLTISEQNGKYTASPPNYKIDLSNDGHTQCDPTSGTNAIRLMRR